MPRPLVPLVPLALLLVATGLARAQGEDEPKRVMVAPFGVSDPATALYDAVELDLELVEQIVLTDPTPLSQQLAGRTLFEMTGDTLQETLGGLGQDAIIAARVDGLPAGVAIFGLFRARDGALVFAKRIELEAALEEPRAVVVRELLEVIVALDDAPPLPPEALVEMGFPAKGGEAPKDQSAVEDEAKEPLALAPRAVEGEAERPLEAPPPAQPAPEDTTAFDRLGRAAVYYAPAYLFYRACQPAVPSSPALPFVCAPPPEVDPTVVTLTAPAGGSLHLEVFPTSFAGLVVEGSLYQSQIRAKVRDQDVPFEPNPFGALGGSLTVAPVVRATWETGDLAFFVGGRAGYHLSWMLAEPHTLRLGAEQLPVTLLPSWFSHTGLVGPTAGVVLSRWLRLAAEADVIVGYHHEWPNAVGGSPWGFGLRGALLVDVDLWGGLYASARFEGEGIAVKTTGLGARYTRALEQFDSGQIALGDARLGLGLGYRF